MVPESKFNRLTQTDILKLHVHDDASIQEMNVSEKVTGSIFREP